MAAQIGVARRMLLPTLPRAPRGTDGVWGVSVVQDEVDVIEPVLRNLLAQGLTHLLVADNGSTDGTRELLDEMAAADPRILVAVDPKPVHLQAERITWLAHRAWRAGAAWVLPFDADEFWFARGETVASFVERSTDDVIHVHFHHSVATSGTSAVDADTEFVMDSVPDPTGKVCARSHPLLEFIQGNHAATRVGSHGHGLYIAHALYRSREQFGRKVARKYRPTNTGTAGVKTHWTEGDVLPAEQIDDSWALISQGRADPRAGHNPVGPMVWAKPAGWSSWDPDGVMPRSSA